MNDDCSSATMLLPQFDESKATSPEQSEGQLPNRTLKIEPTGDFWKGLIKPKIRLMGHWLERAGFQPGNQVSVIFISPGVIELRSFGTTSMQVQQQSLAENADNPF